MFNSKALTEKWSPVLSHEGAGTIKDNYRKAVTAVLLENTENQLREERGMMNEASTVGAISAAGGQAQDTQPALLNPVRCARFVCPPTPRRRRCAACHLSCLARSQVGSMYCSSLFGCCGAKKRELFRHAPPH